MTRHQGNTDILPPGRTSLTRITLGSPGRAWLLNCTLAGLLFLLGMAGCTSKPPDDKGVVIIKDAPPIPRVQFKDITTQAGLKFTHVNGARAGKRLLPETMGSGVAFCDLDGDGKPDLLFVNSRPWPGFEDKDKPLPTLALYRNLGQGRFEDVTRAAGLDLALFGMGITVGDFDNDGRPDVFITGVGGNRLFRNVSDKNGLRFIDVTAKAGDLADANSWPAATGQAFLDHAGSVTFPASAAFLDYDNDGLLDLFVCNYVTWSPKFDYVPGFKVETLEKKVYGSPMLFPGAHCALYRNRGDGTFENVTARAGIEVHADDNPKGKPLGKALGVVVADLDQDGWPDIIVANDTERNFFFHNQRNGTFKEKGRPSGIAYVGARARGAMGIDRGEYRPEQWAIAIGNYAGEPNTFLRLDIPERLQFVDVALTEGLALPSRRPLKFGLFFFDFDLDGLLDLFTCNGHLEPLIDQIQIGEEYPQAAQLFWNSGGKRAFELVTEAQAGPDLFQKIVGRGCAFASLDGQGTLDIVMTQNDGPALLLKNQGGTGNHWVRLHLEGDGQRTNTSAIGARVILTAGGKKYHREITSARGYLSQSEFPITIGLGKTDKIDQVEIIWPGKNAGRQIIRDLAINQTHHVRQSAK